MSILRIVFFALLSFVLCLPVQAEGQRVILVLDASGSMWGQIDGRAKMDIAKDVVGKVVGSWKTDDELGLVAYGHRKKGDCGDIETLIEPSAPVASGFMDKVRGLSPKGKTPMSAAVRQAANSLKFTEKAATVILVSDGIETCDPNPCAVAEELEKLGVALTVHTVGFGLDDKGAVAQLKCLAEKTGGISVIAENADELEGALKQTVEAKVEPPAPPPAPEYNFHGIAEMAPGVALAPPHDQPAWGFATASDANIVRTEYGRDLKLTLEQTGALTATIKTDFAEAKTSFEVASGKATEVKVSLDAGIAQFKGLLDEATPLSNDGAAWTFSRKDGSYVGTSYGTGPRHMFNAGEYHVKLQDGQAIAEADFTVAAGQETAVTVTLGAGSARVVTTYTPGGEAVAEGATIELRKPKDVSGEMPYIATEYGPDRTFRAAAGDYVIVAKLNLAEAAVPFTIKAGQETKVEVSLNAGFLAVNAPTAANGIEVLAGEAGLDGQRKRLGGEAYVQQLNYALNAGTYHVVAYGADNVIVGEKDVVIEPGKRVEISLP